MSGHGGEPRQLARGFDLSDRAHHEMAPRYRDDAVVPETLCFRKGIQPGQWHFRNGLPAGERLVSLGRSGPAVRSGFKTCPTRWMVARRSALTSGRRCSLPPDRARRSSPRSLWASTPPPRTMPSRSAWCRSRACWPCLPWGRLAAGWRFAVAADVATAAATATVSDPVGYLPTVVL